MEAVSAFSAAVDRHVDQSGGRTVGSFLNKIEKLRLPN
jgi:hypothetical protein